jgi:hypothetical protein
MPTLTGWPAGRARAGGIVCEPSEPAAPAGGGALGSFRAQFGNATRVRTSSSRSNLRGGGTGRNVQVSALAMSVGVRGAVPTPGCVVTQLVTQYAQDVWWSQGGSWRHQSLGTRVGSVVESSNLRCITQDAWECLCMTAFGHGANGAPRRPARHTAATGLLISGVPSAPSWASWAGQQPRWTRAEVSAHYGNDQLSVVGRVSANNRPMRSMTMGSTTA